MTGVAAMVARQLHLVDPPPEKPAKGAERWRGGRHPNSVPGAIIEVKSDQLPPAVKTKSATILPFQSVKVSSPRTKSFESRLAEDPVVVGEDRDHGLRALAWRGIPDRFRGECWRLLCGYQPPLKERGQKELSRKRKEYFEYVKQYYETDGMFTADGSQLLAKSGAANDQELKMRWQIHIDVPRTLPDISIFQTTVLREWLERLLYVWSIRHPASGYVQGINDLAAPFLAVFLGEHLDLPNLFRSSKTTCESLIAGLPEDTKLAIEADTYWCLSSMLGYVQDSYTFAQPGIQKMVIRLQSLVEKVDSSLSTHLETVGADFIQFAFRWMNCLLIRELTLSNVTRLWDTYLAEGDGFPTFHVYVCLAFLLHWRDRILSTSDFTEIVMFLQALQDQPVSLKDLETWISRAYVFQWTFEGSNHINEPVKDDVILGW